MTSDGQPKSKAFAWCSYQRHLSDKQQALAGLGK
nr:MAG TPA: hypothetical protein [Caudoviricetes sp.]